MFTEFDTFGQHVAPRQLPALMADEHAKLPAGLKRRIRPRRAERRRRLEQRVLNVPLFRLGR
jgi:hypothetical protein